MDSNVGVNNLIRELKNTTLPKAMWNLEIGSFYLYKGGGTVFVNNFIFEVLADIDGEYIISVENQIEVSLEKSFELLEAFEKGEIIKVKKDI